MTNAEGGGAPPLQVTIDACTGPGGADAETLFFVHGWPDDASLWQKQVEYFRPRFRCVRVTMPHFGGRANAEQRGDLAVSWEHCDWGPAGRRLVAAVRAHCPAKVTLVCHDWGCIWGFYAQLLAPELFKAVVAMDVGPPDMLAPRWANVPKILAVGLAYQYWLITAHVLGRAAAAAGFGQSIGDGMTRGFAWLAKKNLGKNANLGAHITSDDCYPYYYTHRNFWLQLFGLQTPAIRMTPAARNPSCPCLFFWGAAKGFRFHDFGWEKQLLQRQDCDVVQVRADHWLMTEKPDFINARMDQWLSAVLAQVEASPHKTPQGPVFTRAAL